MIAGEGNLVALGRDRQMVADAAGIVDQDMHLVGEPGDFVGHPCGIGQQRQIAAHHIDACIRRGGAQFGQCRSAAAFVAAMDDDVPALFGQHPRRRLADARTGPGDDGAAPSHAAAFASSASAISLRVFATP